MLLLVMATLPAFAQTVKPLKKTLELKMPKTVDDAMAGTRGAGVAWHPVQKKYYAVFAGNMGYPLAVFDATGKRLSAADQAAVVDTRGIWYNPAAKTISGNGYDETGWFNYNLNAKGLIADVVVTIEGLNQPDAQCVGAYNTAAKNVLFLKGSQVWSYKDGMVVDSMMIHWGRKKNEGVSDYEDAAVTPEDYNNTSLIYTGSKGQELGFLNITNKQVELYDIKTGFMTKTLGFPETAITESSFNFAYANGIYWLFDIEKRIWKGYK